MTVGAFLTVDNCEGEMMVQKDLSSAKFQKLGSTPISKLSIAAGRCLYGIYLGNRCGETMVGKTRNLETPEFLRHYSRHKHQQVEESIMEAEAIDHRIKKGYVTDSD